MIPKLVFLLMYAAGAARAQDKRPNIIFILTDDQGSADVGFRNPDSVFVTPNLDALAADAVRLSNYYVHPTCTPTRAALMTGRYAANVGLNLALIPGNPGGLEPRYPTLAEHLGAEGYSTHLVGKWHLGGSMAKHHPLRRGFDSFYGLLGGGFNHVTKQCGGGRYDLWRGEAAEWENQTHATELFNAEALRVVDQQLKSEQPFFLFLSHPAPHDPLMAPERHQRLCEHIPNRRRRLSCAMVAGIDEGVGQLVELLRMRGQLDNTVIAYSVDNGGVPYAGALNYPFRGAKTTVYEGGVRVPGFIYAPNYLGKGREYQGLFHVADFLPTFAALTNSTERIAKAHELDGVDQLGSLLEKASTPARGSVHIHRDLDRDSHAYRRGPWKLIVGHHFIPFFFSKVYTEMKSGWLVEGGGWRDRALELLLTAMDRLLGSENTIFVQYICWVVFDSANVGGLARAGQIGANQQTGLWLKPYKTDLAYWKAQHTKEYPTVSLFNLDEDPQETTNLADQHPDLVASLLAEAEAAVAAAPGMIRGDVVYRHGLVGPQQLLWDGWYASLFSLGSVHSEAVPYGPFLPDDFDASNDADFVRLLDNQKPDAVIIFSKLLLAFVVLPMLLLIGTCRLFLGSK